MIDKKIIEAKLENLKSNKLVVEERLRVAQETIRQANADINAISGAEQLCEQLLEEEKKPEEATAAEAVKNG
jgi:multidrug resistance efflux pump